MDLRAVQAFRTTWKDGGLAKKKKQERLTGFFWFCIRAGWITTTPTLNLKRITVHQKPTDYFPRDEYKKIIDATYCLDDGMERGYDVEKRGQRIRALVQLLRWSGLRIRDAVTLEKTRLQANDDLFLYQAKTGVPVYVPLPHDVAEELRNIPPGPKPNARYFFWSGNGDLLFVAERLAMLLDERKIAVLIRERGMGKVKEGDAPAKLLTTFIRKADEGDLGRLLVETAILLASRSQQDAAKALRDAAEQYKVNVEVIASAVKQEFAAKTKARVEKRAMPKSAGKSSTAKKKAAA